VITQKEMASAIYNCVKEYEKNLIDEKAFLISLSVGVPIDDFYEVNGHLGFHGLSSGYVAACERYLYVIDKYDEKTVLEASLYMFNLIRRGVRGNLSEKASNLLSDLEIFHS
jgi:hypothetical protein